MKSFLIFLLVTVISSNAQNDWSWQNPYPQGNTITSSFFVDSLNGWIAGWGGTIMNTNDGGITWTMQNSNVRNRLLAINFVNKNIGWAVGETCPILYTEDGGLYWTEQDAGKTYSLRTIFFKNENEGFIGGSGRLLRTQNGGETWGQIDIDIGTNIIQSIFFVNNTRGWLTAGGNIYLTYDGGNTWILNALDRSIGGKIVFLNENVGWAVGKYVHQTIDGGITWTSKYIEFPFGGGQITNISFLDSTNGWICGEDGIICNTIDGGETWTQQNFEKQYDLNTISAISTHKSLAGGSYGKIFRSVNGGITWQQSKGTKDGINSLCAINDEKLWCNSSYTLKSIDGGENWILDSTNFGFYSSIFFINETIGWRGGEKLLKTIDGGNTWVEQDIPSSIITRSIFFIDEYNGWAIYDDGIMKTTDGQNWDFIPVEEDLKKIFFINKDTGWVVGTYHAKIYKTNDGGITWTRKLSGVNGWLEDVFFVNNNLGFCVGSDQIIKTVDGGESWQRIDPGTIHFLSSVYFTDENNGYVVGDRALIYSTVDGGENWVQYSVSGMPEYVTLLDVKFINQKVGWIVGKDGTILKTTNGNETNNNSILELTYPNGDEIFEPNDTLLITWISENVDNVKIHYSIDIGQSWSIVTDSTVNSGKYLWIVPQYNSDSCLIKISNLANEDIYDTSDNVFSIVLPTSIPIDISSQVPLKFIVMQNYPNPFNPSTKIKYSIPQKNHVSLKIYNALGKEIITLVNGINSAGNYEVTFDGSNIASGIYFYQIKAGDYLETKKFVLLK